MAATDAQIAQIVVDDLTTFGVQLPFDALDKAEYWASRGRRHMKERSRYNPSIYAEAMGEETLIEYVKGRMSGQGVDTSTPWLQLMGVWQRQAAISYYNSFNACAADQAGDHDALTSTITFTIPLAVPGRMSNTAEINEYNTYKDTGKPVERNQFAGWGVVLLDVFDNGTDPVESELERKYTILSNTETTITLEDHELYYREIYNAATGVGVKFRIVPD